MSILVRDKEDDMEIVISGLSGRFPESENLKEFQDHLFSGTDMVTDSGKRWTPGIHGLPRRLGQIKKLEKFDAQFFGVHGKLAEVMDPQLRLLLEVTYEAIVDAGVNPSTLRGSNTGVFVGASGLETLDAFSLDPDQVTGYGLMGGTHSMLANRVSYAFDFHGPSFPVDTACSSSLLAIHQAVMAIRLGHCEQAIVGGAGLCLRPTTSLHFHKLGMLSPDGKCKSFDATGNGYVRSEAVAAIFIQKNNVARRAYTTILNSKSNTDGFKDKGITFPSGKMQTELLKSVYEEAGISPGQVDYVEAHGTGTKAGDPQEAEALTETFCQQRTRDAPLLIGSVKSNMGHPEPAAGLCSIVKVILAMKNGVIPANLHFESPNPEIPALLDGRMRVVTQNTPWEGGIVGVSGFGWGGANVHIILKSNPKLKPFQSLTNHVIDLPILVPLSGRTRESVQYALNQVVSMTTTDHEQIALLHAIHKEPIIGHAHRGFALIGSSSTTSFNDSNHEVHLQPNNNEEHQIKTRPVWFIFSGMGCQWNEMGRDLMRFPVFENSIKKSAEFLQPHGVDLLDLLLQKGVGSDEKSIEKNVLSAFVSIVSCQVGLVDLLRSVDILADGGMVGHSVGELACAYADNCFTAEETILAALARGQANLDNKFEQPFGMAAVGLAWEESKHRCPPGIYPACHNSMDSVTLAGPLSKLEEFTSVLKSENIFAQMVNSCGQPFHSPYITGAGFKFRENLQKYFGPNFQQQTRLHRSSKWISSSVPESDWELQGNNVSSIDYHVQNMLSPVLFHEATLHIPPHSIVIEVAPHGLLQSILKRSLPTTCTNVSVMRKNSVDNAHHFLTTVGHLFNAGVCPDVANFYDKMEFPVSIKAAHVSPLVQWDHGMNWAVANFDKKHVPGSKETLVEISMDNDSDKFYSGHVIDGRIIFPGTGYLVLVWKVFASLHHQTRMEELAVVFENVQFHHAAFLVKKKSVTFLINIFETTGQFHVEMGGSLAASGVIRLPSSSSNDVRDEFVSANELYSLQKEKSQQNPSSRLRLQAHDIYKELGLRGYEYDQHNFQGLKSAHHDCDEGVIKWRQNWVTFLDSMLQLNVLGKMPRALYLPNRIQKVTLNPGAMPTSSSAILEKNTETREQTEGDVQVHFYKDLNIVKCDGVEIRGLETRVATRRQAEKSTDQAPILEYYEFSPYINNHREEESKILTFFLTVVLDNSHKSVIGGKFKMAEFIDDHYSSHGHLLAPSFKQILDRQPQLFGLKSSNFEITTLSTMDEVEQVPQQEEEVEQDSEFLDKMTKLGIKVLNRMESKLVLEKEWKWDLIILDDLRTLVGSKKVVKEATFVLLRIYKGCDLPNIPNGWSLIGHKCSVEGVNYILIRRQLGQPHVDSICVKIEAGNYEKWIEKLKLAMKKVTSATAASNFDDKGSKILEKNVRLILLSHCDKFGNDFDGFSGILGLVNCLKMETGGDKIRCYFLPNGGGYSLDQLELNFDEPGIILKKLLGQDLLFNILKGGVWGSYCHYPLEIANTAAAAGNIFEDHKNDSELFAQVNSVVTKGTSSTLSWVESPLKFYQSQKPGTVSTSSPLKPKNCELCTVYYASLNFRDIMLASGRLPSDALPGNAAAAANQDSLLGMEFSGKDHSGKRLMGIVFSGSLGTHVEADKNFVWDVPPHWSLAEAATVPMAYATAYYALIIRGRMRRGDSVLIHCGASCVGQAAIAIALEMSCLVFTTVGSLDKQKFLEHQFPQLTSSINFASSRSPSFEQHILHQTKGQGVNLVLNSLSGDKIDASLRCLGLRGQFLEIGKLDLFENRQLGMSILLKNISIHGILLDDLFLSDTEDKKEVVQLLANGVKSGCVVPLTNHIFSAGQIDEAFKLMGSGQRIGKVMLEIRQEEAKAKDGGFDDDVGDMKKKNVLTVMPMTYFDPKKSYIIIGGLGGFAIELVFWMIERRAKIFYLVSRSGVTNGYQDWCLKRWNDMAGVKVTTVKMDLTNDEEEGAKNLLKKVHQNGGSKVVDIGGIFNLAMVLRDSLFEKQTPKIFEEVTKPKINVTIALDKATRELRTGQLDYFVVFSSMTSGRGNLGQANYGFANSAMERICEKRHADGLPALAIQFGAIGDVGVVYETMLTSRKGSDEGQQEVVVGGTVPQPIKSCLSVLDKFLCLQKSQPVVSSIVLPDKNFAKNQQTEGSNDKEGSLSGTSSRENSVQIVGQILGVKDVTQVNHQIMLQDMGMDSLMAGEVKQVLEQDFDVSLSMVQIRELTFDRLKQLVMGEDPGQVPSK